MQSLPVILIVASVIVDVGLGYYCDHNLCHATDEYCCGDNLCCDYANSSSYFWLSILIVLLLLATGWALLSLFFLPALSQRQDVIKLICGRLLNQSRGLRTGPAAAAWNQDPESSPLSRNERTNITMTGKSGVHKSESA